MKNEFYDSNKTYEENYTDGPFGLFRKLPEQEYPKGQYSLFGIPIDIPFGIPAGPLLNSNFVRGAWAWGFSLATYKTVRGTEYPCHPFPNVIRLKSSGNVRPGDTLVGDLNIDSIDVMHDGITNSFGVPSRPVEVWQKDVRETLQEMTPGNLLLLSFMGTKSDTMTSSQYIDDFARTAKLAKETGAPVLEVNFSCPNVGKEGLICNDVETSSTILEAMKPVRGNVPLLVKVGYIPADQQSMLEALLDAIHDHASGVVSINTIQAKVTNDGGQQILPGSPVRLYSGVCGGAIRWAGLEMAERIMAYKKRKGWKDFVVIGVGGVVSPDDYFAYMKLGVDAVQSATGAMWKPDLAIDIRRSGIL
ncbi:MAG: hypothetical protein Q8L37_07060 [Candidatus Gottesmanbacteria bacterium]|nr:hypothetical protein [Candidatus Gottesmanbacteria bacterium]